MLIHRITLAVVAAACPLSTLAVEYSCEVTRKVDAEREYTSEQLANSQFSNRVEELDEGAYVSRCSFAPSAGKVTCDRYKIDRVSFDEYFKIKKYYVFRSHFDFQLFSNLSFVENNGRGSVSYGKCALASP